MPLMAMLDKYLAYLGRHHIIGGRHFLYLPKTPKQAHLKSHRLLLLNHNKDHIKQLVIRGLMFFIKPQSIANA